MILRKQPIILPKESHPVSKLAELVSGALNCVRESQTLLKVKNSVWVLL